MSQGPRKSWTLGAFLSVLALYVQVALPMLLAVQIGIAEPDDAGSAAFALCGGSHGASEADHPGTAGAPGSGGDHGQQCCPLCAVVGASYIVPADIFLPVPTTWTGILLRVTGSVARAVAAVGTYDARGPPLNG